MQSYIVYYRFKLVFMVILLALSAYMTCVQFSAGDYLRLFFYLLTDLFFLAETVISVIVLYMYNKE